MTDTIDTNDTNDTIDTNISDPIKICPMKLINNSTAPPGWKRCDKDHCAWYDTIQQRCSIVSIVKAIRSI